MTCAVTASVAFWFGTNSVADMRDAPCFGLADAGQGVSDEQIHHAPSTERGLDEHHPRRLRPDLADLGGERAAGCRRAARRARRRPPRARRRRRARPRSRRTWGRCRGSRRRRRPQAAPARAASRTTIATPDACASSFSADATPPRVASRRQRSEGPTASSSASTAGQSERVSDSTGASSSNSPRASMTAVPCSPIGPETRIRSPGRSELGESEARGSMRPSPVVVTYIESQLPRSTTFVSPAMISTPAAARRAAIASTSARRSSAERPSSSTSESVSASGRAPGHREVVDGAVDGELADRAAGEADRLDDEAVGRQREAVDHAGVAELAQRVAAEGGHEEPVHERLRRLAAGAVRHRDLGVPGSAPAARARARSAPGRPTRACRRRRHTTSRSRAKRP